MNLLWFDLVFHWTRISSACSPDEIRGIVFPDSVALHPDYGISASHRDYPTALVICDTDALQQKSTAAKKIKANHVPVVIDALNLRQVQSQRQVLHQMSQVQPYAGLRDKIAVFETFGGRR